MIQELVFELFPFLIFVDKSCIRSLLPKLTLPVHIIYTTSVSIHPHPLVLSFQGADMIRSIIDKHNISSVCFDLISKWPQWISDEGSIIIIVGSKSLEFADAWTLVLMNALFFDWIHSYKEWSHIVRSIVHSRYNALMIQMKNFYPLLNHFMQHIHSQ